MSTIHTRLALPEDADAIAPLFNAYRQFYEQADDLALAHAFISERLARQDSVILLAHDAQGTVLGFTQIYPSLCSVLAAPIGVLYDLFVAPAARTGGVGRALLLAAQQYGKSHGLHRLDLTTARTNTRAQSLYESLHWTRDHTFLTYSLDLRALPSTLLQTQTTP
jgi:ribosomal protein S18 acetylase RimI-like enzyme